MKWILREPIVAFLLLGVLLYALSTAFRPTVSVETVDIRAESVRALIKQQEELIGRGLNEKEVCDVVQGYVDDEVLLREARRRGFDEDDFRVRKRLLTMMRSTLDEPVAEPSVAQLQAYQRENADLFRTDPAVTLEQIYFSWGSEKLPDDTAAFLEEVRTHPDPASLGEVSMAGYRLIRESRARLVMFFGGDFADAVMNLTSDTWTGPIESKSGTHFVKVIELHPSEPHTFEQVESYLRQRWEFDKRREAQQKKIDMLKEQYRIELPEEFKEAERP